MQREESNRDNAALGHRSSDMAALDWRTTLTEGGLLRLANPDSEQQQALTERFSLDALHLKDICNPQHPPHFAHLDGGALHIILRFPVDPGREGESSEVSSVSILADRELCALVWPGPRHHHFDPAPFAGLSVPECVSLIIHTLVDHLLRRVYRLRETMEEFEDSCLTDVGRADLGRLLLLRKELSTLARYGRNNAHVIELLRREPDYRDELRLHDGHEHMQRAEAIAESRAEHALNVMQAVQSLLSQRLNDVMKFLAVITVILTPMGIIAGIFGMNFTYMDILAAPNGFAISIWAMLILAVALAILFKIRKWW